MQTFEFYRTDPVLKDNIASASLSTEGSKENGIPRIFLRVVSTMEFDRRDGPELVVSVRSSLIKEKAPILVRQWNARCSRRTTRFLSVPYTSLVSQNGAERGWMKRGATIYRRSRARLKGKSRGSKDCDWNKYR